MKIQFRKLVSHAQIPTKANSDDAAYDLTAVDYAYNPEHGYYEYGTGLALSIPSGYVGLLFQRSSVSNKPLSLANAVGVIDPTYRGEIALRFRSIREHDESEIYQIGDRVGQLMFVKTEEIEFEEMEELTSTVRGFGGFGSTGR